MAAAFHPHRAELVQGAHVVHFANGLSELRKVDFVLPVAPDASSLVVAYKVSNAVCSPTVCGFKLIIALAQETIFFVFGHCETFECQAAFQRITMKIDHFQRRHLVENPFFEPLDFVVGEIETF